MHFQNNNRYTFEALNMLFEKILQKLGWFVQKLHKGVKIMILREQPNFLWSGVGAILWLPGGFKSSHQNRKTVFLHVNAACTESSNDNDIP